MVDADQCFGDDRTSAVPNPASRYEAAFCTRNLIVLASSIPIPSLIQEPRRAPTAMLRRLHGFGKRRTFSAEQVRKGQTFRLPVEVCPARYVNGANRRISPRYGINVRQRRVSPASERWSNSIRIVSNERYDCIRGRRLLRPADRSLALSLENSRMYPELLCRGPDAAQFSGLPERMRFSWFSASFEVTPVNRFCTGLGWLVKQGIIPTGVTCDCAEVLEVLSEPIFSMRT